jgi:hypothetical protein
VRDRTAAIVFGVGVHGERSINIDFGAEGLHLIHGNFRFQESRAAIVPMPAAGYKGRQRRKK